MLSTEPLFHVYLMSCRLPAPAWPLPEQSRSAPTDARLSARRSAAHSLARDWPRVARCLLKDEPPRAPGRSRAGFQGRSYNARAGCARDHLKIGDLG